MIGHLARWFGDHRSDWRHWAPRLGTETALTPLRISVSYLVVGMGALFLSDVVFVQYLTEPFLSRIQAVKGGVEVILTAGFIFALTARREAQLQRSIDQYNRQNEQLQVLHRVLRHNLRNDLNVIQGYATWLHERLQTEQFASKCGKIIETSERMTRYTEQAARIRGITKGDDLTRTYDLTETIPTLLDRHPQLTEDVDVSTRIPDSARIEANQMFEAAVKEVLTNAIKYTDAETPRIDIDVGPAYGAPDMLEIRISDNGPGIPESEIEPIRTGKEGPVVHLSGLGLWFVAWTVRHSGGEIDFETSEGGGTTVVLRLPRAP